MDTMYLSLRHVHERKCHVHGVSGHVHARFVHVHEIHGHQHVNRSYVHVIHGHLNGGGVILRTMPRSRYAHPDAVHFGEIMRSLRLQRGWTLEMLARRCGMNRTYFGILERGENIPSLPTILEIADVLGVDAGEIVREVAARRRPPTLRVSSTDETELGSGSDPNPS